MHVPAFVVGAFVKVLGMGEIGPRLFVRVGPMIHFAKLPGVVTGKFEVFGPGDPSVWKNLGQYVKN